MRLASTALPALFLLTAPLHALQGDVLEAGPRWTHPSTAADPWVPASLSFGGLDDLVLASARGESPRLLALDSAATAWPQARATALEIGEGTGGLDLIGTSDASRAFALLQPETADAGQRRTELRALDPTRDLVQLWSYELPFSTPTPARAVASDDGEIVVLAAHRESAGLVQLDWIDGRTGVRFARKFLQGGNLAQLELSGDGRRAALLSADRLYVLDERGQLIHTEHLLAPARSIAFDADGDRLAIGGEQQVAVLQETRGGFSVAHSLYPGAEHWFAMAVDISPAGDALAIGWWNTSSGAEVRYELWETEPLSLVHSTLQSSSELQHLPTVALFSASGRRAAFGGWGAGDDQPEALLVDRSSGEILLEVDVPGSVHALALDRSGNRLAVAHKDNHANLASSTGAVRLFATGEPELELLEAPEIGGSLRLAARHPDQGFVFFLVGETAEPTPFGEAGDLLLDYHSLTVFARLADPVTGRADLDLELNAGPELVGQRLGLQVAFRSIRGLGLGTTLLEPLILD